ncbi:MAG TPA: hypothetical protein VH163_07815 [Gemmatimonadales bacterium]|jgi:hypothetical protein|nr:hypothetical protein [Gemmatimonadales bacterium]
MEARTIFIDAHAMRRHERVSALKECLAAVVLIQAGWKDATSTGLTLLSIPDLVVGFSLLGIGIIELKRSKKFGTWVRWCDITAGGLMALEALALATEGHRGETLIYGYYGLGALYVLAGLFHRQLGWRRYVRLDDDGVQVRMTPLQSFRVGWPDISRVVGHADSIEIFAKGEKRYEIARRYVPNLDEIRELMVERASGRGIAT